MFRDKVHDPSDVLVLEFQDGNTSTVIQLSFYCSLYSLDRSHNLKLSQFLFCISVLSHTRRPQVQIFESQTVVHPTIGRDGPGPPRSHLYQEEGRGRKDGGPSVGENERLRSCPY